MAVWNDLSVDSKKEVIKRLDLMSRTAMRCTSRAHREIVDSTEFYVPRVRFSTKLTECMVMIYTGIEKFLRIEIDTLDEGVKVYRMENTYDRAQATTRAIPSIGSYHLCYEIMKALFLHESVLLGALEIEFPYPGLAEPQKMLVAFMKRSLGERRFRTKRLITNCQTILETELMLYRNMCDPKVLEELSNEGVRLDTEFLESRKIMDVTTLPEKLGGVVVKNGDDIQVAKYIDVPSYETHIWMAPMRVQAPVLLTNKAQGTNGFATVRFGLFPGEPDLWDYQAHPIERLNEHVLMKRHACPELGLTIRWNKSKCGLWVHMVKTCNEHKYLKYFKSEKCGLRWLCRKCTDPFEQWFYKELPRRVFYEPEWNHLALEFSEDSKVPNAKVKELVRKMRAQYAKADKRRGAKKTSAESWGFKKSNGPKRAPPKFVLGKDIDDIAGHIESGKTLHVDVENYEIIRSEWVKTHGKAKSALEFSDNQGFFQKAGKMLRDYLLFGSAEEVEKAAPPPPPNKKVLENMSLKEMLESSGLNITILPDDEEGEKLLEAGEKYLEAMRKLKMEQVRKEIDSTSPLEDVIQKLLASANGDQASVVELKSVAEKKTEKNRKKKEKKKNKKAQQQEQPFEQHIEPFNMV